MKPLSPESLISKFNNNVTEEDEVRFRIKMWNDQFSFVSTLTDCVRCRTCCFQFLG